MKQPLLGQKIQEWRKAKGLTQEELVERCNLNVRTIQRIEAGEVTPRSYTIKSILEVLEVKPDEVQAVEESTEVLKNTKKGSFSSWLRLSIISGIFYLILSMIESLTDIQLLIENKSYDQISFFWYLTLKMGILILFLFFNISFFKLAEVFGNLLMKVMTVILVLATCLFLIEDIIVFFLQIDSIFSLILRSLISGIIYILFGASFLNQYKQNGSTHIVAGTVGLVTGICFMTVVFAVPGLLLLTIFELVLIVLLYQEFQKASVPRQAFGTDVLV
ncbi:helix-turn-helix transcriptional regulator [Belliella sp. DSM 111904]|uniref:Helix-turn-helix transcriptional regulator n=1 Tax=Belliella filtrata TaxID=2923435 RepID=A0ABS9UYS4_9BACT|nr:helix-turn-helix transcriptional regulator [Belliella filtrata]MCH7409325.1 helix-turn-helix transcriptional regulator [Belliella filtrata]